MGFLKKFSVLLFLLSLEQNSTSEVLVTKEAAELNKQQIKRQNEGRPLRRLERFKRKDGIMGFVRHVPNTIIKDADLKQDEGYLVNSFGQKWPVFFTDKEPNAKSPVTPSNFYLGYFYDLEDRKIRHVYLKIPSL